MAAEGNVVGENTKQRLGRGMSLGKTPDDGWEGSPRSQAAVECLSS